MRLVPDTCARCIAPRACVGSQVRGVHDRAAAVEPQLPPVRSPPSCQPQLSSPLGHTQLSISNVEHSPRLLATFKELAISKCALVSRKCCAPNRVCVFGRLACASTCTGPVTTLVLCASIRHRCIRHRPSQAAIRAVRVLQAPAARGHEPAAAAAADAPAALAAGTAVQAVARMVPRCTRHGGAGTSDNSFQVPLYILFSFCSG